MAEGSSPKPCFQCEKNPRLAGDFLCGSCKEEHDLCYECGERKRNHPFYLCTPCYRASQSRGPPAGVTPGTSGGSSSPAVLSKARRPHVSSPSSRTGRSVPPKSPQARVQPTADDDSDPTCILPGCSKPKYTDKLSGYVHDFCGKTHAQEYKRTYGTVLQQRDTTPTLLRLGNDQNTYKDLVKLFKKEWVKTSEAYPNPPDLSAIYAIQNPWLVEQFQGYSTEVRQRGFASNSDRFFHGTTIKCDLLTTNDCCSSQDCGICGISRRGFDKSKIGSNIPRFKRFGHGIYLAPNSSKCHDYTQGVAEYGVRAQLLCLVACGARYEQLWDNTKLEQPPESYHSVHGKSGGSLNYDEVVVYDVDAVLPQYIFVYAHDGVDKIAK